MPILRERLEEIERETLASYGVKSGDSLGPQYPDDPPKYRTLFQRDRGRILHTTAFRRLEYKTQVFVNFEGDYYRTRLTHTLEVAQLGRTVARALGVNEDLVEGICLAHDLGHPPFGHSGEYALNDLMKDHGGFEHNKQTLRIVTKLEKRYSGWQGLNLTYEMREGIVKHESEYDESDGHSEYRPSLRGTIEAQIANLADEMAYNAHDLDDGLRADLIRPSQLKHLNIWNELCEDAGFDGEMIDELTRHRMIRKLINRQVRDLIANTTKNIEAAGVQTVDDVQNLDHNLVKHSDDFAAMMRPFKDFLYKNLYYHYRVVRMSRKARRFLSDLFESYISEPRQLPATVQKSIDERGLYRPVCDYIAGMTDRFALQEWQRLFAPFERP